MVVFIPGQTDTHSLGFCLWQTWLQAVGRASVSRVTSGRMVMQPSADFLVGGSNPGRAHMAWWRRRRWQSTGKDSNQLVGMHIPVVTTHGQMVAQPTADFSVGGWSLLITNYYIMPWGMLRN